MRLVVERGSMPYSAVTQPRPEPLIKGGTRSSMVAVHSTCVSPRRIMHEPSACLVMPVSIETARISLKSLPEGRILYPLCSFIAAIQGCRPEWQPRLTPRAVQTLMPKAFRGTLLSGKETNMTEGSRVLEEMNERSREVFRRVVEAYLLTGVPVGSRSLTRELSEKLSAATVRNVMQDLEYMGLLNSPHVSAGRVPTQSGLRMFVDGLLEVGDLQSSDRALMDSTVT